jgi:hypothetical protein
MYTEEKTRVREQGTIVTNPADFDDAGLARINALKQIVEAKQYAKIDGIMVDLFSASAIVNVYNALNEDNQVKYRNCNVVKMSNIAFKLMK